MPDFFHQNCTSCHTIGGGRLLGPDLMGVTKRKDRDWLVRFLQDPKAMIESGDPYAVKLQQDAHGIVMPTIPGLSPSMAQSLLDYIDSSSGQPKPAPAEPGFGDQPFTAGQVAEGKRLFTGRSRLANGGPACISCHTLENLGPLGGGRLGPDLTRIEERLGGRRGVATWLSSPPTATMQSVFRKRPLAPQEIVALLAFIEDAAGSGQPAAARPQIEFLLLGVGGMTIGLVSLGTIWRRRFRAVRQPLVQGRLRGEP